MPRWLARLTVVFLVAAAAITVALQVTPMQTVTVAGQVIRVGVTTPDGSLSGPGQIDLFGQSFPTRLHFPGPVRPRLQLTRITLNSELANFVQGTTPAGAERVLGQRLADGWMHYFAWETAITGLTALALLGALAGWRRLPRAATIKLLAAGLVVTEAINLGAIMVTAYQAPGQLRQVRSLSALVGTAAPVPRTTTASPPLRGVQAVVMGDSTASGAGLPPVPAASHVDIACGRSADSYAEDLAAANKWRVMNLACDGATVRQGILGQQSRSGQYLPAQIASARRVRGDSAVIVSIGADDLHWSTMVEYCAVAPSCDDRASTAYFQQQLASFGTDYLQLLGELATLPGHPRVIINKYYDPFGPQLRCLRRVGLTPAKVHTLRSRLNALNTVLAKGAADFGFTSVQPDFTGHGLCAKVPYVQGLQDVAPFHPTAPGQLAIALADQAALATATKSGQPPT